MNQKPLACPAAYSGGTTAERRPPSGGKGLDQVVHQDGVLYVRSKMDGLYAIDAAAGRERWCAPSFGALPGAPVVTSHAVFIATDGGAVHALRIADGDTRNGALLWHTEASLLEVRDGLAYVNPPDASLTALDPRTGVVRWSAPPEKSGGQVHPGCLRRGTALRAQRQCRHRLEADDVRPGTGGVRWTAP
ncbi:MULTISPECIES: PQQ-binding-like beta-propeller repeat protein, partial [unclassified Streptomyces]|uniref:outer membrane protein assembly factor BamB family protein n=1 Tax=unclassified Streptomyces TaxID=2593676 RepID=UPI0036668FB1